MVRQNNFACYTFTAACVQVINSTYLHIMLSIRIIFVYIRLLTNAAARNTSANKYILFLTGNWDKEDLIEIVSWNGNEFIELVYYAYLYSIWIILYSSEQQ